MRLMSVMFQQILLLMCMWTRLFGKCIHGVLVKAAIGAPRAGGVPLQEGRSGKAAGPAVGYGPQAGRMHQNPGSGPPEAKEKPGAGRHSSICTTLPMPGSQL